jgi:hypothetical protein
VAKIQAGSAAKLTKVPPVSLDGVPLHSCFCLPWVEIFIPALSGRNERRLIIKMVLRLIRQYGLVIFDKQIKTDGLTLHLAIRRIRKSSFPCFGFGFTKVAGERSHENSSNYWLLVRLRLQINLKLDMSGVVFAPVDGATCSPIVGRQKHATKIQNSRLQLSGSAVDSSRVQHFCTVHYYLH